MPSQSGINDDELNKMIASLQQEQGGASVPVSSPAGHMVVQPPAQDNQMVQPAESTVSVSAPGTDTAKAAVNVFGQPASVSEPTEPSSQSASGASVPVVDAPAVAPASNLDEIKREAITELRPLVDKLNLPAEDKFDTLLLLIRTTDDSSLIPAAHIAARAIADDSRRAQALLDVIKEIDFFGQKK